VPRKSSDDLDSAPRIDSPESAPRPRARVTAPQRPQGSRLILAIRISAALAVLLAAVYAFHRLDQFLIRDARFALNGPEGSPETSTLTIQGQSHSSRRALEAVFAQDSGQSVYLLPLADRRASLRSVDWVKDASVARLWPNRVVVRVQERQPVAFITLSAARFALIDEEGVILPPAPGRFHLPVLAGVKAQDPIAARRDRVRRMLRVLQELGPAADQIAEVDMADRDNVKITQPYDGRVVSLLLGDQDFGLRYRNFVNHYGEIKQKLPDARTLDLRLEDRITVVDQ